MCVNFPLPVPLNTSHLLFLLPELFLEIVQLILQLLVFRLNLDDVHLQTLPLIVDISLSLLNFLHVVLHLALEVILQEVD